MPKSSDVQWAGNSWKGWRPGIQAFVARQALEKKVSNGAALPDVLEAGEAWQLYIPNLTDADIERGPVLPAHGMAVLGMAFGVVSPICGPLKEQGLRRLGPKGPRPQELGPRREPGCGFGGSWG